MAGAGWYCNEDEDGEEEIFVGGAGPRCGVDGFVVVP